MIFVVQEWNKANVEDYSKTRSNITQYRSMIYMIK
jgi:hypothetical protein